MGLFIIIGVGVLCMAWVVLRRGPREIPLDGSVCVACEKPGVVSIGPDAYRCPSCGYEGGRGMPALLRAQEKKEVSLFSPEERAAKARALRAEARRILTAAAAELDATQRALAAERQWVGLSPERALERALAAELNGPPLANRRGVGVAAAVIEARHLLERAGDYDPAAQPKVPAPLPDLNVDLGETYTLDALTAQVHALLVALPPSSS